MAYDWPEYRIELACEENRKFKPRITVATIVEDDNSFLFVREATAAGMCINQPAGHLEAGETLQQAAIRETLEETAWQVELRALVGIYLYQAANGITYQRVCFSARPLAKLEQALDPDISEAVWLSQQQLLAVREQCRSPLVLRCLEDYLQGSSYCLAAIKGLL